MYRKYTQETFIEKSNKKHNYRYSYTKTIFRNVSNYIIVTCPYHGDFTVRANMHLLRSGCPQCRLTLSGKTLFDIRQEKLNMLSKKFPNYIFNNNLINGHITYICPKHGEIKQRLGAILKESFSGCPKCNDHKLTKDKFIKKSKILHGNKYDYDLVPDNIKYGIKVNIICKKHGKFLQLVDNHLHPLAYGCKKCKCSKGEERIRNILSNMNLNFIEQYEFDDCVNEQGNNLIFDFYLNKLNMCIEYDGEQHFHNYRFEKSNDRLMKIQQHDKLKNEYCIRNNIKLLRIHYSDFNNIEKILSTYQFH